MFNWDSGLTDFFVVVKEEYIAASKRLFYTKNFKRKPMVVNLNWLIDSLEEGAPITDAERLTKDYVVHILTD